ncbi:NUDIX hydrolase [Nonomuraea gerenzanensis]|uniref:Adenosylhomocysteinase n=1 Tax=Nonomuraea gerenzanensis TaxID=93944 RepID=A0A1M4DZH9_9ACTN|nr:NUDIX domain-containing protein [Nonomuraea gerenzanensis]UBU14270.1 NUDIX domain-containing protein [Nonomuraea gerenzanensis]SBO91970.1 Adenosylhomocysteinase [Nonomuraea gerenzanensis]
MTVTREEITAVLGRYLAAHPDRAADVELLEQALARGGQDLASRKTLPLHVTASAAAIDDTDHVLMIHHRALNRWLLPGGHVEPEDHSLYGAALRELEEETGLPWRHAVSPPAPDLIPVDIDVHYIPANPSKGESAHLHADFRFGFRVQPSAITIQAEEVTAFAWRPPTDLPTPRLAASVAAV